MKRILQEKGLSTDDIPAMEQSASFFIINKVCGKKFHDAMLSDNSDFLLYAGQAFDIYLESPHPRYKSDYWSLFSCTCLVALTLLLERN